MKKILTIIIFLLCSLAMNAQEYRDVVYLKNGSVIKGFYKSFFMNDTLRMETLDGSTLVCPVSDIERIAKERTDVYVVQIDDEDGIVRRWRPKGYSGSVEYLYGYRTNNSALTSTGFATLHGYQFGRNIFLGAGIGAELYTLQSGGYKVEPVNASVSFFGEGRLYLLRTRIAPVLSLRGGYTATGIVGAFVCPSVGVDFSITPRFGGFVRAGYRWQHFKYTWKDIGDVNTAETIQEGDANFLVLSVGVHF